MVMMSFLRCQNGHFPSHRALSSSCMQAWELFEDIYKYLFQPFKTKEPLPCAGHPAVLLAAAVSSEMLHQLTNPTPPIPLKAGSLLHPVLWFLNKSTFSFHSVLISAGSCATHAWPVQCGSSSLSSVITAIAELNLARFTHPHAYCTSSLYTHNRSRLPVSKELPFTTSLPYLTQ